MWSLEKYDWLSYSRFLAWVIRYIFHCCQYSRPTREEKNKNKMHYHILVLLNSSAAVWKISYLFMKSNMVMNYSGIKQHTYLNMLVKLVYELSYMYIQRTGGMVLKDLCWSDSCRRPKFIMAYLTQFKLFNKVILYM